MVVATPIVDMLSEYVQIGGERWHMPGHKGKIPAGGDFLQWSYDVTEIDPLWHEPNPIQESEALMAQTYGARATWYSVAGATLPVMVGILAANPPGSTLVVDRSLHRSVLGALIIGDYQVRWVYPPLLKAGLALPISVSEQDLSGAQGLVVTRPTYDGLAQSLVSTIESAHRVGMTVFIDEAHGSHWTGVRYPPSAIQQGADLVAHGVHKTESALTQTGLLHLLTSRVDQAEIERWWRLLSTSSPSYLLLASLDRLQAERHLPSYRTQWEDLATRVESLWHSLETRGFVILQSWGRRQGWDVDPARLTIIGSGTELRRRLQPWGEVEKVTPGSCTLILSPGDGLESISPRLSDPPLGALEYLQTLSYPVLDSAMRPSQAFKAAGQWVRLGQAAGRVMKEALTPYPPGIPVVVPGEILSPAMVEWLAWWLQEMPVPIQGVRQEEGQWWVWAVKE